MILEDFGWTHFFAEPFERFRNRGLIPGRIVQLHRGLVLVRTETAQARARIRGHSSWSGLDQQPVVGDWVACHCLAGTELRIEAVLPRQTLLSRKVAGNQTLEQPVAANVHRVFLVGALDRDRSLRPLERMLTTVYESGATPVIALNKADLHENPDAVVREIETIGLGAKVLLVSGLTGVGLESLQEHLIPRQTVAFIGASGVGKSTLINRLFGYEVMRTQAVSSRDLRGRHTTTHRELIRHPDGALLIDNPGIRELQLWASRESLDSSFADLQSLALECRFRDCSHDSEPGCAVLKEVRRGAVPLERLESYRKLEKELRYLRVRRNDRAKREQKRKWKSIHRAQKRFYRDRC